MTTLMKALDEKLCEEHERMAEVGARKTILDEASEIVSGDREAVYGPPAKNLKTAAQLWTTWLKSREKLLPLSSIDIDDVAMLMVLLKTARLSNNPKHRDSQVDICGYLRLLERCQTGE